MSIRSIIIFTGNREMYGAQTFRIYKHSDGYPTGVLPQLAQAIEKALTQCHLDTLRWKRIGGRESKPNAGQLTSLFIGECASVHGLGAILEGQSEKFTPKALGIQEDLEWIYIVDLNKRTVGVYGGGYTGKPPQHAYKQGVVDPLKYAESIRDEHQARERSKIESAISDLRFLGFTVLEKKKRKNKTKLKAVKA